MTTANSKSPDTMLKSELLEHVRSLEEQLKKSNEPVPVTGNPMTFAPKDYDYDEDDINIRPDKYIRVVSLCPHVLNLSTAKHGNNKKTFRFANLGQEKRIMYQHLVDIIETHPTFTEAGLFYIMNKDVVRRHGLDDAYSEILTNRQMSQVIDDDTDTALGIFNNANERQQSYIAEILETKIVEGEHVDMNLVYHVGQITGIDVMARAENTKSYKDINKK